jgi:hypothetical protein
MTKWVCFDEPGACTVQSTGAKPALRDGNALMAALGGAGRSVIVMPTGNAQELALVSVFKRQMPKRAAAPVIEFARPISRTATGFLGLTDEPEFADEPQRKPWWKRWSN